MKGKTITTVVASVIIFIAIIFVLIAVGGEEGNCSFPFFAHTYTREDSSFIGQQ